MSELLTIVPRPIGVPSTGPGSSAQRSKEPQGQSFDAILRGKLDAPEVKFSRHASDRLLQRNIQMTSDQQARLNQAVSQVGTKGGRDSLVLLDNLAMVVSIKNQTVVTVVEQNRLSENIFTNIDSAVIA